MRGVVSILQPLEQAAACPPNTSMPASSSKITISELVLVLEPTGTILPSGERTVCYGKSPSFVDQSTINGPFSSSQTVKLPEASPTPKPWHQPSIPTPKWPSKSRTTSRNRATRPRFVTRCFQRRHTWRQQRLGQRETWRSGDGEVALFFIAIQNMDSKGGSGKTDSCFTVFQVKSCESEIQVVYLQVGMQSLLL